MKRSPCHLLLSLPWNALILLSVLCKNDPMSHLCSHKYTALSLRHYAWKQIKCCLTLLLPVLYWDSLKQTMKWTVCGWNSDVVESFAEAGLIRLLCFQSHASCLSPGSGEVDSGQLYQPLGKSDETSSWALPRGCRPSGARANILVSNERNWEREERAKTPKKGQKFIFQPAYDCHVQHTASLFSQPVLGLHSLIVLSWLKWVTSGEVQSLRCECVCVISYSRFHIQRTGRYICAKALVSDSCQ